MLAGIFPAESIAQNQPIDGKITAEVLEPYRPYERKIFVRGPDPSPAGMIVSSVFNEELERRGFELDIAAPFTLELVWAGDFEAVGNRRSRITVHGEGGSRSEPSLSLNLKLGLPRDDASGRIYTIDSRLMTNEGPVWQAKAVARTRSENIKYVVRIIAGELIEAFGKNIQERNFRSKSR